MHKLSLKGDFKRIEYLAIESSIIFAVTVSFKQDTVYLKLTHYSNISPHLTLPHNFGGIWAQTTPPNKAFTNTLLQRIQVILIKTRGLYSNQCQAVF